MERTHHICYYMHINVLMAYRYCAPGRTLIMNKAEAMHNNDDYPIDIVIAWVDGSDPEWKALKDSYDSGFAGAATDNTVRTDSDDSDERYRDWDILKYLFRGIENCMPWVRTIHFVSCGQIPVWLNVSHPKLHLVSHTDYIPSQYLPTFNSHTIELNFHRIEGLSEHFIYFNDDMFITSPLDRHDFFIGGKPVDMLALQPVVANPQNEVMSHIYLNNTLAIARHFNKYDNMHQYPHNYFNIHYPMKNYVYNNLERVFPLYTGFYTTHGASPLCISTYKEVWEKEHDLLDATCSHRFRNKEDVSQYLLREWQKQTDQFVSVNIDKLLGYYNISNDSKSIVRAILSRSKKTLCINDSNTPVDFMRIKSELTQAFEQVFPDKSQFEVL